MSQIVLSQINPIPYIDSYFFKIHSNIVLLFMPSGLSRGIFPVGSPIKILKALLLSSIFTTCSEHLNVLDLITLTILGERYKL